MSHIRIRQICLVAHDLGRVQRLCESVFGVEVCYRDPGVGKYGLHNFLIPFGDQFLETVSPQSGEHDTPGGRYLERRGGDGGYMVIMQVSQESFPSYRERVDQLGIRLVSEPGQGEHGMGMQLHPKDLPGAIAEVRWNIDEERPDGAEARVHGPLERQLIEMFDIFERVEGQLLQVQLRICQGLEFRRGVGDAAPGNARLFLAVRVLLLPQIVAQLHAVER